MTGVAGSALARFQPGHAHPVSNSAHIQVSVGNFIIDIYLSGYVDAGVVCNCNGGILGFDAEHILAH